LEKAGIGEVAMEIVINGNSYNIYSLLLEIAGISEVAMEK